MFFDPEADREETEGRVLLGPPRLYVLEALVGQGIPVTSTAATTLDGKLAACQGRMATEAVAVLTADPAVTTMPAKAEGLIAELVKRPDYRNRKQRDDEEKAQLKAQRDAAKAAEDVQKAKDDADRAAAVAANKAEKP